MGRALFGVLGLFLLNILLYCGHAQDALLHIEPNWSPLFTGEKVTFICDLKEVNNADWVYSFRWKDHWFINYRPENRFTLSSLTAGDSGEYQCAASQKSSNVRESNKVSLSVSEKPKAKLRKYSVGGRVTLTCSVGSSSSSSSPSSSSSSGWKYFWYRDEKTSEPLKTGDDVLLQSGSISPSGRGVYWCRGGRGDPVYYTEYSHPVVINRAVVTLQHDWPEIYSGETITLTCGIEEGGGSEWEYEWRTPGYYTPPNPRGSMRTSSVTGDYSCKGRLKDGASTTKWSEAFTVKTSAKPKAQLRKYSPVWGRVTLTCSVGSSSPSSSSSSGWKYFWYKRNKYSAPLKTGDDVLLQSGSFSHSGGGVYWCRGGRGDPVYYTEYSHPVVTNRAVVKPNWPEIYSGETITLTCGIKEGGGSEWEYEWRTPDYYTPPNPRGSMMTSSVRGDYSCKGRLKDGASTTEWSDAFTVKISEKPKAQLRKDSPVAGRVTLTCSVGSSSSPSSSGWKYFWYKHNKYSEPLKPGDDVLLQSGSISPSGGGVYWCRGGRGGGRGDPVYYTEYSHPVVTNRAVVTLQHDWPEIYSGETITLTCGIEEGGGSEWEYEWRTPDYYTPPNPRGSMMTSSVRGDYSCKGRLKDGASTTEWSDAFTVKTSAAKPKAQLRKYSPVAGSVTLTCSVGSSSSSRSSSSSSSGWKYFWYKDDKTSEPLKTGDDVLLQSGSFSHSGGGVYWCRGGRGDPVYYTEYSRPVVTNRADVKPNWPEIYSGETITLTCGIEEGGGSEWEYEWRTPDYYTPPHPRGSMMTSSVRGDYSCKGRLKDGASTTEWSDAFTVKTSAAKPKAQLRKYSVGGHVTLTCSVESSSSSSSSGWKYFWYKDDKTSEPLKTGDDVLLQSGSISPSGGGVYWCRGGRGAPVYYTEYSHPVVTNRAVVTLQHDWPEIYSGETITLTCGIEEGGGSEWEYEWRTPDYYTPPNPRESMITSSVRGDYSCKGRLKDGASTTEWSDAFTVKTSDVPQPVLTVSPSWTSPGDSVTLTCSVEPPSAGWRFFWYQAVPELSLNYTYELLVGNTTGTEQDSYILHGQTHTAGYVCRAGRGDPVFYTLYSDVKFVWSGGEFVHTFIFLHKRINVLFVLTLFVLCVSPNDVFSGVNPAASLTVSPHRLQHFSTESLSLSCEGNSTEWKVMKADESGFMSSCSYWGQMTGSTCNTDTRASSGVYWCESATQSSNAANITTHNPEEAASSSVFLLLLVVGLVSGVLLIILLLLILCCYRKSKASSLSRSQRTNQSPATDHMINQGETQDGHYAALLHGDSCLYETIRGSGQCEPGTNDEPEESDYQNVMMETAAGTSSTTDHVVQYE
ncbi:uncharacterized protein LOC120813962 isoform X2 [Gasterosteus aculeatus]